MLYHVESVIILHSSGALMNFFTQQRYKFLNYNQSQTSRVCHFIFMLERCAVCCVASLCGVCVVVYWCETDVISS